MKIPVRINKHPVELEARTDETLLTALRRSGFHSVRLTCGIGVCGACTVLIDGEPISSCLVLAPAASGSDMTTTEGFDDDDPVATAFQEVSAVIVADEVGGEFAARFGVGADVTSELAAAGEPHAAFRLHGANEILEQAHARGTAA